MQARTIAVLGGGIAGLSTAYELIQKGYQVLLLEARDYYGGRIRSISIENIDGYIELGANWVESSLHYQNQDNFLEELAALQTTRVSLFSKSIFLDEQLSAELTQSLIDYCAELYNQIENYPSNITIDEAFEQAYLANPHHFKLTKADIKGVFISTFFNSDRGMSVKDIMNNTEQRADSKHFSECLVDSWYESYFANLVTDGYQQLPLTILSLLEKSQLFTGMLEHEVVHVDSAGSSVIIQAHHQNEIKHFEVDAVVSTIPSGVLKQKAADLFFPQLPNNQLQALQRIQQAKANKVVLVFENAFWDNDKPLLFFKSDLAESHIEVLNLAHPNINQGPGLIFWLNDHYADYESEQAIIQTCLSLLHKHYGDNVTDPIEAKLTDWNRDPYASGAWTASGASTEKPGDKQLIADFVPENKLWFAGEFTSAYGGSVHGAYISGLCTAHSVDHFFRQSLSAIIDSCHTQNDKAIIDLLDPMEKIESRYHLLHEHRTLFPLQMAIHNNNKPLFIHLLKTGLSFTGRANPFFSDYQQLLQITKKHPLRLFNFLFYALRFDPRFVLRETKQFVICLFRAKIKPLFVFMNKKLRRIS